MNESAKDIIRLLIEKDLTFQGAIEVLEACRIALIGSQLASARNTDKLQVAIDKEVYEECSPDNSHGVFYYINDLYARIKALEERIG